MARKSGFAVCIFSPAHPILGAMLRQYELVEKVRGYDPDADEAMINAPTSSR
jgi:hypothetical protein